MIIDVTGYNRRRRELELNKNVEDTDKLSFDDTIKNDNETDINEDVNAIVLNDISGKTVKELRLIAKEKEIADYYKLSKDELIKAIQDKQ